MGIVKIKHLYIFLLWVVL